MLLPAALTPLPVRLSGDASGVENLSHLLAAYGGPQSLPTTGNDQADDPQVDLIKLVESLPERVGPSPGEPSRARTELLAYLEAVPPRIRLRGVSMRASAILGLLLDRLEIHDRLGRETVRMCKGVGCVHYDVCPFAAVVANVTDRDRVPCAVERDVVKHTAESFLTPQAGRPAVIDGRRPEQALLFAELVELLVKKTRLAMYLQMQDALVDHFEPLRSGADERFDSANQVEHPLLASWERTQNQILKVMQSLGVTPEFQIKQNLYVDADAQVDAERRARELAGQMLKDSLQRQLDQMPGDDPNRLALEQTLREV